MHDHTRQIHLTCTCCMSKKKNVERKSSMAADKEDSPIARSAAAIMNDLAKYMVE